MDIEQFRATGAHTKDIGVTINDESLLGCQGRVYLGTLFIQVWDDSAHTPPPGGKPTWLLILGREEYHGRLTEMEQRLYNWAKAEGYFDDETANEKAE